MTTRIKLKKSSVSSNAPSTGDLEYGELAINYADGRLYYKNSSNLIKNFIDSDLINTTIDTKIAAVGGIDSATVLAITQANSVDSNEVINLIDSAYVQLRQDYAYTSLTGAPNVLDSANVASIVTSYGYTTCTGTVTSVSAGTGLTGGPITTSGSLSLDTAGAGAANYTGGISAVNVDAYGRVTSVTGSAGYTTCTGTVTSVTVSAGTGLSGGGTVTTSGTATLNLDFSELTDMTGDITGSTEFILQDGTTESRKAANEIKLSNFVNDAGWTSYDSADTIGLVDSAYVQARQDYAYTSLTGAPNVLDSADVIAIHNAQGGGGLDSAAVQGIVDSDWTTRGINDLSDGVTTNTSVGLGNGALASSTGLYNTAVGICALFGNTAGSCNTSLGSFSLRCNTTGIQNVGVGVLTFGNNTIGSYNVAVGSYALRNNTIGNCNTAIGYYGLYSNTSGADNTAVGRAALYGNTTGGCNVALGANALCSNTTSYGNTSIGYQALTTKGFGNNNTAVGCRALACTTSASCNTAVGKNAGLNNTTGQYNSYFGDTAGTSTTTAACNVALGFGAGVFGNCGCNVSIGANSAYFCGVENVAIGHCAGKTIKRNGNTIVGSQALKNATTSCCNVAVGYLAMCAVTTSQNNTVVGSIALCSLTTGTNNTVVGRGAGNTLTTGSNNIVLGCGADVSSATVSNEITLGDANITSLRIPGLQSGATTGDVLTYDGSKLVLQAASGGGLDSAAALALFTEGTAIDISTGQISVDLSELSTSTTDGDGDYFVVVDSSNVQRKLTKGNINISGFNNNAGYTTCTGTVTSVSAGTGLTGGPITTSGSLSLATAGAGASNYTGGISAVNVDAYGRVTSVTGSAGYTTCTGTVTSVGVTAGTGLSGGGTVTTSGSVTLDLDFAELTDMTGDISGTTEFILQDGTTESRKAASEIKLSNFNNDVGWTTYDSNATITLVDSAYVQLRAIGLDYNVLSNKPAAGGLDSAAVLGLLSIDNLSDGIADATQVGLGSGALASSTGSTNTAVGLCALYFNTTGGCNTSLGGFALRCNTTGNWNVGIGVNALINSTTASDNTAVGSQALQNTTTGSYNTALGRFAMCGNTTGACNTATGYGALQGNTTGFNNTAVGFCSLYSNTTGIYNTAQGACSLRLNTTGGCNTAVGFRSIYENTAGSSNTAVGFYSLYSNTTGGCNAALGFRSLFSNTTGIYNTAQGACSLYSNTTGNNNTVVGFRSLWTNTIGTNNTSIGLCSLYSNTSGTSNVAVGSYGLRSNTTGFHNIAVGVHALCGNTTGKCNTAVGYGSLCVNTVGCDNVAMGQLSLRNNTGNFNTALGRASLLSNTTGTNNTAVGHHSLFYNTTTGCNVAVGNSAAEYLAGFNNVSVGYLAGNGGPTLSCGTNNTAVGTCALQYVKGSQNVAIGSKTLSNLTTGNQNIMVGYGSGALTTGCNNIIIGYNAAASAGNISNEITLGDANITSLRIPGLQSGASTGDVLTYDGSKLVLSAPSGGGASSWVTKTANYTASNGDRIVADTTGGTFTITLPAAPSAGDQVTIADGGDFSVTNLTVGRNGSTIEGTADDVTIDIKDILVDFVYDSDATWQIYTQGLISNQYGILEDSSNVMYPTMVYHDSDTSGFKITSNKFSFDASSGTLSVTDLNSTSDVSLKENISVINNAIDKLKSINGVSFKWKDNKRSAVGVIAQEVEKVLPELVDTNVRGEKSVKYNGIIGLLVEAVKEQQKTIEELTRLVNKD